MRYFCRNAKFLYDLKNLQRPDVEARQNKQAVRLTDGFSCNHFASLVTRLTKLNAFQYICGTVSA